MDGRLIIPWFGKQACVRGVEAKDKEEVRQWRGPPLLDSFGCWPVTVGASLKCGRQPRRRWNMYMSTVACSNRDMSLSKRCPLIDHPSFE